MGMAVVFDYSCCLVLLNNILQREASKVMVRCQGCVQENRKANASCWSKPTDGTLVVIKLRLTALEAKYFILSSKVHCQQFATKPINDFVQNCSLRRPITQKVYSNEFCKTQCSANSFNIVNSSKMHNWVELSTWSFHKLKINPLTLTTVAIWVQL